MSAGTPRAFSSEVDTGSHEENATKQESGAILRFGETRNCSRPEFLILTGPLGSGKTTLLSDYLTHCDSSDTGVLVNDAGEINVDGAIIAADHRDLAMAQLSDGCICCSMGNDLQDGIDALLRARAALGRLAPSRIILETSGLAEPGPILRSLRDIRQMTFDLRIVCTVDATGPTTPEDALPAFAAQIAAAHTLVLTKLDAVPPADWHARGEAARALAPLAAHVVAALPGAERAHAVFARPTSASERPVSLFAATPARHDRIAVVSVRWAADAAWEEIGGWVDDIAGLLGSRLLRLKGVVQASDVATPLLINGVGQTFSPPRPIRLDSTDRLGLTMIVRDTSEAEVATDFGRRAPPELRFG